MRAIALCLFAVGACSNWSDGRDVSIKEEIKAEVSLPVMAPPELLVEKLTEAAASVGTTDAKVSVAEPKTTVRRDTTDSKDKK